MKIDYSWLEQKLTTADLKQESKQNERLKKLLNSKPLWQFGTPLALVCFIVLMSIPSSFTGSGGFLVYSVRWLMLAACVVVMFIAAVKFTNFINLKRFILIHRFARNNGFTAQEYIKDPNQPGLIFNSGRDRYTRDIISGKFSDEQIPFETGRHFYTTGSGKNRTTHEWRYVRLKVKRNLPHMVLDSIKGDLRIFGKRLISNLPSSFKSSQELSLEGDFDKYFTLYVPDEYERDALYVLTPDLMQLLIDKARGCDIEIIDSYVYFYFKERHTRRGDVDAMKRIFELLDGLGGKFDDRTDSYSDDKVIKKSSTSAAANVPGGAANNVVGQQGRRLATRVNWLFIIIIVVFLIFRFLSVIGEIVSR